MAPRRAGILCFTRENARLGFTATRRGLGYTRGLEYPLAYRALALEGPCDLLDVGCGRLAVFARVAARAGGARVVGVDARADLGFRPVPGLRLVRADATRLPFGDGSFDRVSLVSSVEHFAGEGDGAAMREAARVLRPRGLVVLTAPYNRLGLSEQWREGPVYGVGRPGERRFFERAYDDRALRDRLIAPSGLEELERRYFAETGLSFERFENRWLRGGLGARLLNLPFALLMPLWTRLFLHDLGGVPPAPGAGKAAGKGGGVLLVLRKPAAGT